MVTKKKATAAPAPSTAKVESPVSTIIISSLTGLWHASIRLHGEKKVRSASALSLPELLAGLIEEYPNAEVSLDA